MQIVDTWAGQNWLITPAALAVTEASPRNISGQNWLLVLSGIAITDFKGRSPANWLGETLRIYPDVPSPLNYAIDKYAIPRPGPVNHTLSFQVEQGTPFAAISSIFNKDQSVNSGFSVNVWRPTPYVSGTDAVSGQTFDRLFTGIDVDVAVRDSDAWLYRVSYQIILLGKIVFKLDRV